MNFKTDFIASSPSNNEWSGVYGYRPDTHKELFQFGELFAVMRLKTEVDGFNLERMAKVLMLEIHENYFNNDLLEEKGSHLEILEAALWKMKSKMEVVLAKEDAILEKGIDLELAVVTVINNILYAVVVGESKVYIARDGNFVDVSEALIDTKKGEFIRSGSLEVKDKDKFLISTFNVVEKAGATIEEMVDKLDVTLLEEQLESDPGSSLLLFADELLDWPKEEEEKEEILETEDNSELDEEISEEDDSEEKTVKTIKSNDKFEKESDDKGDIENSSINSLDDQSQSKGKNIANQIKGHAKNVQSVLSTRIDKFRNKGSESEEDFDENEEIIEKNDRAENRYSKLEKDKSPVESALSVISPITNFIKSIVSKVRKHFEENQTTYVKVLKDAFGKIKSLLAKAKELFDKEIVGDPRARRLAYQKKKLRRNRIIFAVVTLLLVYFIYSNVTTTLNNNTEQEVRDEKLQVYNGFKADLEQIKTDSLITTNANSIITRLSTLEKSIQFESTDDVLTQDEVTRLNNLLIEIQNTEDDILNIDSFSQPSIVADIGSLFPDASLYDIEYANNNLFITDNARSVIYKTGIELQSDVDVFTSEVNEPTNLVRNVAGDIIFFDSQSNDSGIGKFSPSTPGTLTRFTGLSLSNTGFINEVAIFEGNDALYEIHNTNNQIFKRDKDGSSYFGGGATYVADNPPNWKTSREIGSAIDIDAPFEIYVLSKGQGLFRYLGGGENTLTFNSFSGLSQAEFAKFTTASSIDATAGYLAVGIPNERKIMLFSIADTPDKPLTLIKQQYVYRGERAIF
ncbi:MAG: hypothetical protein Q9M91_05750 [Candidatus Dojkabacteria bacterium]|nr:hypothetical protein [Candidatus Dojkabacteria bacterium]